MGNIRVDLSWKDGKPERISLFSENSQNVEIVYKGKRIGGFVELKKEEQQILDLCSMVIQ